MNEQVIHNCAEVMDVFTSYQKLCEEGGVEKALHVLSQHKTRFQSVAYESISMFFAYSILQTEASNWTDWNNFFEKYKSNFSTQLQVGLGWAMAKSQQIKWGQIAGLDKEKILDGYGYFYGIFRSRLTVKAAQIPDEIEKEDLPFFDRGLGRSLWYLSKGNLEQLARLLDVFGSDRKEDLLQGIGLASAFVGGMLCENWNQLFRAFDKHVPFIKKGILQANYSCFLSQTQQGEMETIMQCVFQLTPKQGVELVHK